MTVFANNRFPFPPQRFLPPRAPLGGAGGAPLCRAGSGLPGRLGGHPAHLLLLHLPRPSHSLVSRERKQLGLPGRPVSSTGGRTKRGWQAVKWLPVGQSCRLPALPAPNPLAACAGSSLLWRCWSLAALPSSGPHPGKAAWGSPASCPHVTVLQAKCYVVTCSQRTLPSSSNLLRLGAVL